MFRFNLIGIFLLSTFFAACSSAPKVEEFADTANPATEVESLTTDMKSAMERQVNVLSPSSFEEARDAMNDAVEEQKRGKDAKTVLHSVAVSRSHLKRANQFAEVSRTNLEAVVSARTAAIAADAPNLLKKDFSYADDELRGVTSDVENNDLAGVAEKSTKLQKWYLDLELTAIKQTNLGPSRSTINTAMNEGAKDYAEQSLAIAQKSLSDADAYITANRHQTESIAARSAEATTAANHLLKITRAAKLGKNVSPEQNALNLESEQLKAQQSEEQLAAANASAKSTAQETSDLKSDAAFNRSFEMARREFASSEAEVYRKGNSLVARLKSLEFPNNQAVIKASNFPLLAKVGKVIKEFGNASVIVEGHTDSVGRKAANTELSKQRAQAVSDYLVSTDVVVKERINVAGYGFDRPLATNKTAKGRAQNRRVDIIITPGTGNSASVDTM